MIKVVNPFNRNMEEVYTAANSCACRCSVGEYATSRGATADIGKLNETTFCSCGYGTDNQAANTAM